MVAQNFTLKIVNMVSGLCMFCYNFKYNISVFENFIHMLYFGHTHHPPPRPTLYPSTDSQLRVISSNKDKSLLSSFCAAHIYTRGYGDIHWNMACLQGHIFKENLTLFPRHHGLPVAPLLETKAHEPLPHGLPHFFKAPQSYEDTLQD